MFFLGEFLFFDVFCVFRFCFFPLGRFSFFVLFFLSFFFLEVFLPLYSFCSFWFSVFSLLWGRVVERVIEAGFLVLFDGFLVAFKGFLGVNILQEVCSGCLRCFSKCFCLAFWKNCFSLLKENWFRYRRYRKT